MKTKILTSLLIIIFSMMYSQDSLHYLTYDFAKSEYKTIAKEIKNNELATNKPKKQSNSSDSNKELKNNTEYFIQITNINPFYYKVSFQVKQRDKVKEAFEFLIGAIAGNTKKEPVDKESLRPDIGFEKLYDDALLIEASLKNSFILEKTKNDINGFEENNFLLESYLKYNEDLAKNPSTETKREFTEEKVQKLNSLMNEAYNFIVVQESILTLGKFKTDGTDYTFELTFTPPKDNINNQSAITDISKFTSKSNMKVHFSGGLMMANPLNSEYYVSEKNANDRYTINEENRGDLTLGVMTLAHFMFDTDKRNGQYKIGPSVGAGIDLDKQLRFLLGGSFMLNNIFLSIGYNWAYKNVLSDKFQPNVEYLEQPEISHKKVLKGGIWFGISYRID